MNGPQVVCAGCGAATGMYVPLCDQCARNYVELVGEIPSCLLCEQGNKANRWGLHLTALGGYMGKCTITSISSETQGPK